MRFLPLQMPPLRFIFYHIFSLHSILFQSFFRTKAKFDIFHNRFVQFVQSLLYHDGHRIKNILRSVEGAEAFLAFFKPFRDRSVGFARFGNMHETARTGNINEFTLGYFPRKAVFRDQSFHRNRKAAAEAQNAVPLARAHDKTFHT